MTLKRAMRGSLALAVFLLLPFSVILAQDKTITGKVIDGQTNSPLAAATVQASGTNIGTATDSDGSFSINVPESVKTLMVTAVGYQMQEVPITQGQLLISMKVTAFDLEEVVVVGYGTVKKKDLTGAVSSIQSRDFNQGIETSPDQLIKGKTPGVMIINNTGQPGSSTTVRIRGNSSIRAGNNPLFVLDGIPLSGNSVRPGGSSGFSSDGGNPLDYLNPNDIASIDILKDASATAIYGSRGANGVVMITTKRGQSGDPTIHVNAAGGISHLLRRPEVLSANQFREALKVYTPDDVSSSDFGGNVDALDAILRTSVNQNYNISVDGGNDRGRYRLSLGYLDQNGIVKTSELKKYTANFNSSFKFLKNKRLGLDLNMFYTETAEHLAPIDVVVGFEGNLISQALNWNPTRPLRDNNGDLTFVTPTIINPLTSLQAFKDRTALSTFIVNLTPSYKFTDWLEYKMILSLTRQNGRRTGMYDRLQIDPANNSKGMAFIGNNSEIDKQLTHTLNFNKDIADGLSLDAVLGYEYLSYDSRWNSESGDGFTNVGLDFYDYLGYSVSSSRNINSNRTPTNELQSYFLRAGLNYESKYLLTATVRRDGSTKFGANNKYAYFPSIAAAWNISSEDFMKNSSFFNNLKLRLGWGRTGNSEFPSGASKDTYVFGMQSISQTNFGNPDLRWEASSTINAGIDFAVLDNRLSGSVDYFHKSTTDALFERTLAQPAPTAKIWVNLDGKVINKGVEVALSGDVVRTRDWNWNIGVNATFLQNEVTALDGFYETAVLRGQGFSGVVGQRMVGGQPLNVWYLSIFEGIDPSTGMSMYRSEDGHSGTDVDPAQNKFYVHSPNPKSLLGINTSVSYKRFALQASMNGAFGHYLFNNTLATVIGLNNLSGKNISPFYFKPDLNESTSNSAAPSTRYLEKGNYMKLTNATLSYRVGDIRDVIKNLRISLTAQNLFVLTNYSGFDPEVNTNGDNNGIPSLGIEYVPYPSARTFLLGVNFSL